MARASKIDKLPPEIREAIGRLRQDNHSIDEILAHLGQLGGAAAEIKRSSLGRHVKTLARVADKMSQSRAMAEALVAKFGSEPDDRVQRLNIEMLHGIVFQTLLAQGSSDDGDEDADLVLSAKDAKLLSETLRNLSNAQKVETDRMMKIAAAALSKAAEKVDTIARREGWSAETARNVRAEILGVRLTPAATP